MIKKDGRGRQKTAKEQEIEISVKKMFERKVQNDDEDMPEVFASVNDKTERKRKSSQFGEDDESSVSSSQYVPPVRLLQLNSTNQDSEIYRPRREFNSGRVPSNLLPTIRVSTVSQVRILTKMQKSI